MNSTIYFNTALGSCLTIILIAADYLRKFNTDMFQRRLLIAILGAAFVSVITDFLGKIASGIPGLQIHIAMYVLISIFLVVQNICFYMTAAFIDYFAHNDIARSWKFIVVFGIFIVVYTLSVIANLPLGFYFVISADNIYVPGKLYLLRLLISYAPILIIIPDVCMASKYFKQSHAYLIVFFIIITSIGAALEIFFRRGGILWPCFSAAILYIYFFIIRTDSKIDSLTGMGNRYSFNEFINKLSKQNTRENYSIVMIDLDRFKEINDTLGHIEGDNALRDMAAIIKGSIRHSDFAARYGGDEFVLAAKAETDIKRVIDRIIESIEIQNRMRVRPYQLYMSYGYDMFTTNSGRSIYDFIAHIDSLMYKHKEERRKAGIASSITAELQKPK